MPKSLTILKFSDIEALSRARLFKLFKPVKSAPENWRVHPVLLTGMEWIGHTVGINHIVGTIDIPTCSRSDESSILPEECLLSQFENLVRSIKEVIPLDDCLLTYI